MRLDSAFMALIACPCCGDMFMVNASPVQRFALAYNGAWGAVSMRCLRSRASRLIVRPTRTSCLVLLYSKHEPILHTRIPDDVLRHISAFFVALLVMLCLNFGAKERLAKDWPTTSEELLVMLHIENTQGLLPDGSVETRQIVQRVTRTGASLEELKRSVVDLETNQERDETAARLLDELDASDTVERSSVVAQLIWRTWLFHEVSDTRNLVQVGSDVLAHGDLQGAECCFLEAIAKDPEHLEAWHQLAQVHFQMGEHEKSLADVRSALFLESRHFSALQLQSVLLTRLDMVDEATEARQEAEAMSLTLRGLDLKACFAKALQEEVAARASTATSFCEVMSC